MKLTTIDRDTLKFIRTVLQSKLDNLIEGVKFDLGNIRFTSTNATIKVNMSLVGGSGEVQTEEKNNWKRYAPLEGLPEDGIGKRIYVSGNSGRKLVEIIGFSSRSRKYPILVKDVLTGKIFKYGVYPIQMGFKEIPELSYNP